MGFLTYPIQYSDDTAIILAKQLLENSTPESKIAVVSAPSVFIQLKNLLVRLHGIIILEQNSRIQGIEIISKSKFKSKSKSSDKSPRVRSTVWCLSGICTL